MHDAILNSTPSDAHSRSRPAVRVRTLLALSFSMLFLSFSVVLGVLSVKEFVGAFLDSDALIGGLIHAINTAVISLATFELGIGVGKEYTQEDSDDLYAGVRRSVTRFVGVVCIALVLEGLIMVIKYSQLELAGNLGYPVAIIASSSLLLVALGLFLFLTRDQGCEDGNRRAADP
jgi:hypothetical protein